jgi:hypothetical protein
MAEDRVQWWALVFVGVSLQVLPLDCIKPGMQSNNECGSHLLVFNMTQIRAFVI